MAWAIFLSALLMANIDCIVWGSTWSKHHITNCSYLNESDISVDRAPDALVAGDYFIPGILSSFGLILLNVVSWEHWMAVPFLREVRGRSVVTF